MNISGATKVVFALLAVTVVCLCAVLFWPLHARPELTESRAEMVANMFARGDLREPEQQQLIRSYMLDPARTHQELTAFAGVFPNHNNAISNNLLTTTRSPTRDELAAHDAEALGIVNQWIDDPAFEALKPQLSTMLDRLTIFVGKAVSPSNGAQPPGSTAPPP